jgi:hypothetical protein
MINAFVGCTMAVLSLTWPLDSTWRRHRFSAGLIIGGEDRLGRSSFPQTVPGQYMTIRRPLYADLYGVQLGFRVAKRLTLLLRGDYLSTYSGVDMPGLNTYPGYSTQLVNMYPAPHAYEHTVLAGLGYELLMRGRWRIRLAGLGGLTTQKPFSQSVLIRQTGTNYYRRIDYLPQWSTGPILLATVSLGYACRIWGRLPTRVLLTYGHGYTHLPVRYVVRDNDMLGNLGTSQAEESFGNRPVRMAVGLDFTF